MLLPINIYFRSRKPRTHSTPLTPTTMLPAPRPTTTNNPSTKRTRQHPAPTASTTQTWPPPTQPVTLQCSRRLSPPLPAPQPPTTTSTATTTTQATRIIQQLCSQRSISSIRSSTSQMAPTTASTIPLAITCKRLSLLSAITTHQQQATTPTTTLTTTQVCWKKAPTLQPPTIASWQQQPQQCHREHQHPLRTHRHRLRLPLLTTRVRTSLVPMTKPQPIHNKHSPCLTTMPYKVINIF